MLNQILAHVSNTPFDLIDYKSTDIALEVYSFVCHGTILDNADIRSLAERYKVSVPQLAIRHALSADAKQLIRFRVVQALGASVGVVLAGAIIRDFYQGHHTAKMLSTLKTILAVVPCSG